MAALKDRAYDLCTSSGAPEGIGDFGRALGATGAIFVVKAIYELQRMNGRHGMITMCIGGGQGIAMVIERV